MFKKWMDKIMLHFGRLLIGCIVFTAAGILDAGDIVLPARILSDATLLQAVNQRRSVRSYQTKPVEYEALSWILEAADKAEFMGREWGKLIVMIDEAVYLYDRNSHQLKADNQAVPGLRMYPAPVSLYLVPVSGEENDELWVWRGMAGQAVYLGAAILNLATVTVRGVGFPIGYAASSATWKPREIEDDHMPAPGSVMDASLESVIFDENRTDRTNEKLTESEILDLLWAVYGYSMLEENNGRIHRTVPSAHGKYPMKVYLAEADGVYQYVPDTHAVQKIKKGDVRSSIVSASDIAGGDKTAVLLIFLCDRNRQASRQMALYEAGAMAYNLQLAGRALGRPVNSGMITSAGSIKKALGVGVTEQLEPLLICSVSVSGPAKTFGQYKDGSYIGEVKSWPALKVKVIVENGRLSDIQILEDLSTPEFSEQVINVLPGQMILKNGIDVEAVSGATLSSENLKKAVTEALARAQ